MDYKKTMIVAFSFAVFATSAFADQPPEDDGQGAPPPIERQPPLPPIARRPVLPEEYPVPLPPPPPPAPSCQDLFAANAMLPPICAPIYPCDPFLFGGAWYPHVVPSYCAAQGIIPGYPAPIPQPVVQPYGYGYGGGGVVINPGFGGFGRGYAGRGYGGNLAVTPRPGFGGGRRGGFGRLSAQDVCSVQQDASGTWTVKSPVGEIVFTSLLRNNDGQAEAKAKKIELETKSTKCKLPGTANKSYDI